VGVLSAFLQAGIIGCLLQTVRGVADGFTTAGFFSSVRKSGMSLFWLQLLIGLIMLGVFVGLVLTGVIGFAFVLMPLKEAGNQMAAFAVGVPFITVMILFLIAFAFLTYAGGMFAQISLVDGNRGAVSAIGDTYEFIKAHFWDAILFTLLVLFLMFCVDMLLELLGLPFRFAGKGSVLVLLFMVPVMLVSTLVRMYASLIGHASFVEVYVAALTPQAMPSGHNEFIIDAVVAGPEGTETPQEPPIYPAPDTDAPEAAGNEESDNQGSRTDGQPDEPYGGHREP